MEWPPNPHLLRAVEILVERHPSIMSGRIKTWGSLHSRVVVDLLEQARVCQTCLGVFLDPEGREERECPGCRAGAPVGTRD